LAITQLPPNYELEQFDPKQPTQNHAAFAKNILMGVAAALDCPYFYLAGDMEAVNFSSSRVGLDDARDIWKGLQDFVATTLCREVYHAWARSAYMSGQLEITPEEFAEIQNPLWRARGWRYIDPTKDVASDVERLKNRLTTPSNILAEQGVDYVDFLETWKEDKELAMQYGVDIEAIYSEPQPVAEPATKESEPDDEDEDDELDDEEIEDKRATLSENGNGKRFLF
jgi:capsid protein